MQKGKGYITTCTALSMYVQVQSLVQAWPYFEGLVVPLCDQPLKDVEQVQDQVQQLTKTVRVSVIDQGGGSDSV